MDLDFRLSDLLKVLHEIHDSGYEYINLSDLEEDAEYGFPPSLSISAYDGDIIVDYDSVDSIDMKSDEVSNSLHWENDFKFTSTSLKALYHFSNLEFMSQDPENIKKIKETQSNTRYLIASIENGCSNFTLEELNIFLNALKNYEHYIKENPNEFTPSAKSHLVKIDSELDRLRKTFMNRGFNF
ncbi:hypothetical protein [Clostridium perfringens]|uniref:hypothetical protein n=1 Tax=Clostridium perfringens TaxID=1502 RepID=UPI00096A804E|nr:hypothetical protein [Clostridium perfringens]